MNDYMFVLLKGFVIGLSIAALIGPIAMLCIKKTLNKGFASGFCIGLGAATADGVYGAIAAFGVITVSNFLNSYGDALKLIGGMFLLYLGGKSIIMALKGIDIKHAEISMEGSLVKDFIAIFLLTLTNPATIVIFLSIFAGLDVSGYDSNILSVLLVIGFFLGSLLFYVVLAYALSLMKHKLSDRVIHVISIVSGLVIFAFGVISITSVLYG